MLLVITLSNSYAQVGIPGNNPNKDAALDLNNTTGTASKGLLLPQVALTGLTSPAPLSTNTAGMHVYNTATAGSGSTQVIPGEYTNNGTSWQRIATIGWGLQGNANTTASNFIGTTDAVDLTIRTNNTEQMRVSSAGKVLLGTSTVPTGGNNAKVIINNNTTPGALQLKDGTEGLNYILTADANGLATWKPQTLESFSTNTYGAGYNIPSSPLNKWYYTGTSITLPPGKWLVSATMLLSKGATMYTGPTESWWIGSSFSDSLTTLGFSPDIIDGKYISGLLPPNSPYNILSGSTIINNTTGSNKVYYYIALVGQTSPTASGQLLNFGSGSWGENNIRWQAID
ncbi:hypothetical protein [Flavobacterium notoginsengisoli]|uniref:hypothetical protein n=1 Tax=Flavobacterium notoginsengisoli TaxID=1478199 RepID=UPI00363C5176